MSVASSKIKSFERKTKLEKPKHELEKEFKASALASYNQDRTELLGLEPVDENHISFVAYIEAIIFGMIPREEFESWISYYEKRVKNV